MKTKENLVKLGLTEKQADDVMLLESVMMKRAVRFSFKKKDGTIREAFGTLNRKLMLLPNGELWAPKGEPKAQKENIVGYFDMEVQDWRSLIVSNLVSVGA